MKPMEPCWLRLHWLESTAPSWCRCPQTTTPSRQWHGCCDGVPIRRALSPWPCMNARLGHTMTAGPDIGATCWGCCRGTMSPAPAATSSVAAAGYRASYEAVRPVEMTSKRFGAARASPSVVGHGPTIHVFVMPQGKTWMDGRCRRMTAGAHQPRREEFIARRALSLVKAYEHVRRLVMLLPRLSSCANEPAHIFDSAKFDYGPR